MPESAGGTTDTTTGRRPRAEETAARRGRLLEAASALAAEGGYEAVQMRDVAARAGVALGTLYRQFSSKDQLLLACLAAQAAALQEQLTSDPPVGTTPAARLADVLRRASRAIERDPRLSAAMVTALSSPDPAAAVAKLEVYDRLIAMIAEAAGDGAGRDLDAVARVLGYVWFSALEFWVGGLIDGDEMASELAEAARLLLD